LRVSRILFIHLIRPRSLSTTPGAESRNGKQQSIMRTLLSMYTFWVTFSSNCVI